MSVRDVVDQRPLEELHPSNGRRWLVLLVVVCVVAVGLGLTVQRQRHVTQQEFLAFAERLQTLPAPSAGFAPAEVPAPQFGDASPGWWSKEVAWEATVGPGEERAACAAVLDWLVVSGAALGLTEPGSNETMSDCLSVVKEISATGAGSSTDSWGGRGTQTTDGRLRYRTGLEMSSGPESGLVVFRVLADATVAQD